MGRLWPRDGRACAIGRRRKRTPLQGATIALLLFLGSGSAWIRLRFGRLLLLRRLSTLLPAALALARAVLTRLMIKSRLLMRALGLAGFRGGWPFACGTDAARLLPLRLRLPGGKLVSPGCQYGRTPVE